MVEVILWSHLHVPFDHTSIWSHVIITSTMQSTRLISSCMEAARIYSLRMMKCGILSYKSYAETILDLSKKVIAPDNEQCQYLVHLSKQHSDFCRV